MSEIDALIDKLCPNGTVYRAIAEIANISRGQVMSKDFLRDNAGEYPVYSSQTENNGMLGKITTYMFDGEYLTWTTDGANAGTVFYRNGKFSVTNVCGVVDVTDDAVSTKYLFYALNRDAPQYVNKGMGNPKLMSNVMARIRIPLPPLPVQQEIVRILDNFTELTAELNKNLEEELTARRKQYEHYRDELLTTPADSTMMALGAIADYRRGSFPQPYGNSEWYGGVGAMPFVQVADVEENGMVLREQTKQQISVVAQPKSVYVPAGTVICSIQGSIGRVAITQYDAYVDRTLAIFEKYKTDINKRYFAYQIQRKFGIEKEFARGSTLKTITKEEFTKFEIPVPPITEQERIVSVLDRFDTLCNDLTSGLPAEIAARQKQYEYYRDKLLTFKELEG